MTNAARTTDRVRTQWRAKGVSGSFRLELPRRTDHHQSVEVMSQNAEPNPRVGPIPTAQATPSPLVLATAQADRRFLPAAPALLSPEPPLAFMRRPGGAESSFIRQADLFDVRVTQQLLIILRAKPAIGGDDVRGPRNGPRMACQGRGQEGAILRIPRIDLVVRDQPRLSLGEQRFVAKLRLRAQLPAPNGARLRVKYAHEPVGDRRRAADAGTGLGH